MLTQIHVSAVPDQIGFIQTVIVALDHRGGLWRKVGDNPWESVELPPCPTPR